MIGQRNTPSQLLQFSPGQGKVVDVEAAADLLAAGPDESIVRARWCVPIQTGPTFSRLNPAFSDLP